MALVRGLRSPHNQVQAYGQLLLSNHRGLGSSVITPGWGEVGDHLTAA